MKSTVIKNGKIVLEEKIVEGNILIENGKIISTSIWNEKKLDNNYEIIDAKGMYIMPGLIDIHSDSIEKEIEPRPNTIFPFIMSFYELEKKLISSGITTIYHSLSLGAGGGIRNSEKLTEIIKHIDTFKRERSMMRHNIHLRYEITYIEGLKALKDLIDSNMVDYMSFMDHTPGHGQYATDAEYEVYVKKNWGITGDDVKDLIEKVKFLQTKINWDELKGMVTYAKLKGISTASHDDDTNENINKDIMCGINIVEFPINLQTAIYAKEKGLRVCIGAPNIVRGKSHYNNMRAMDAVKVGAGDILCSDYHPSALIYSIFCVGNEIGDLSKAVAMASINPARAVGISGFTGSISEGKNADLILVELFNGYPIVRRTIYNGITVYEGNYITKEN